MCGLATQGSGISIIIACGSERPPMTRNSSALSRQAESLCCSLTIGKSFGMSFPNSSDSRRPWRAFIQFTLPLSVLISPLWHTYRYGCASGQVGNVFVLNRECTSASALVRLASMRS